MHIVPDLLESYTCFPLLTKSLVIHATFFKRIKILDLTPCDSCMQCRNHLFGPGKKGEKMVKTQLPASGADVLIRLDFPPHKLMYGFVLSHSSPGCRFYKNVVFIHGNTHRVRAEILKEIPCINLATKEKY